MHEHEVYDVCDHCLGMGVVVRTRRDGKTMTVESVPCPHCAGGILLETARTEIVEDKDE